MTTTNIFHSNSPPKLILYSKILQCSKSSVPDNCLDLKSFHDFFIRNKIHAHAYIYVVYNFEHTNWNNHIVSWIVFYSCGAIWPSEIMHVLTVSKLLVNRILRDSCIDNDTLFIQVMCCHNVYQKIVFID